jgi:glycosyltransferase involved in cell wall biosynthesis
LLVLTSKFARLSSVLIEAICLNKFVISTGCPTESREILDNNKGGILFNIGDSESLAKNIIYFSKKRKILIVNWLLQVKGYIGLTMIII